MITIIWVTCVQKNRFEFLLSSLLAKCWFFKKLPLISHIHQNCNFLVSLEFFRIGIDQLLLLYKFHVSSMREILLFNSASCEPLNHTKEFRCHKKDQIWNKRVNQRSVSSNTLVDTPACKLAQYTLLRYLALTGIPLKWS